MKNLTKSMVVLALAATAGISPMINSCVHQPFVVPDSLLTGDPTICFNRDILPIFQSSCAKSGCHNAASREEGYVLDSYAGIMKKGIVKGNPSASKIYQSIIGTPGVDRMPQVGPSLPDASIQLIKRWIAAGATNDTSACTDNCDTATYTYNSAIKPMMQKYCAGCHYTSPKNFNTYTDIKEQAVNGNLIPCIEHASGFAPMPESGSKFTDCQITVIKKWVAAGAQEN